MIHIIWTGKGFLVAVITFGCSFIANLISDSATGSEAYWEAHRWPLAVSLLISGLACWWLAVRLRNRGGRVLFDPKNGEKVVIGNEHTLFFIPVVWWGPILALVGLILLGMEFAR
jgi:hypothetical protein